MRKSPARGSWSLKNLPIRSQPEPEREREVPHSARAYGRYVSEIRTVRQLAITSVLSDAYFRLLCLRIVSE